MELSNRDTHQAQKKKKDREPRSRIKIKPLFEEEDEEKRRGEKWLWRNEVSAICNHLVYVLQT